MSGIIGVYFFNDGLVETNILQAMLEQIKCLGQDYSSLWKEGSIGLGNTLFHTTSESMDENYPLINKEGNLILITDARIDNRGELISALKLKEVSTDSEIILSSYEKWGEECPKKLIGDFAFAIWDRYNHRLFCARDALGVRPFYYYKGADFFAFASSTKAIFVLPFVRKELNDDMLLDYLVGNFNNSENTEFKNLYRLPPAHSITVTKNNLRVTEYWDIEPGIILKLRSAVEYKEAFLDIFKEAVNCRLRINGNLGLALSGGLDSTSILYITKDLKNQNNFIGDIIPYSVTFPGKEFDEKDSVFSIQEKLGTKVCFIELTRSTSLWELPEMICTDSQPFVAFQGSILLDIASKAYEDGVRVIFTGQGGDEFMNSNSNLITYLLYQAKLFKACKYFLNYAKYHELSKAYLSSLIIKKAFRGFVPANIRKSLNYLNFQRSYPWLSKNHISRVFDRQSSNSAHLTKKKFKNELQKNNYCLIHSGYLHRFLEDIYRFSHSRRQVEFRMPFYDRRLVEFALSVPDDILVFDGRQKAFLREILKLADLDKITNQKVKLGTTFVLEDELIFNSKRVQTLLGSSVLASLGLINSRIAKSIYNSCCENYIAGSYSANLIGFWYLLVLESWLRRVFGLETNQGAKDKFVYSKV